MPRWALVALGAVVFGALYAVMAVVFGDVGTANVVFGTILAAGVGALVTTVFVAGRSRRRQPRV